MIEPAVVAEEPSKIEDLCYNLRMGLFRNKVTRRSYDNSIRSTSGFYPFEFLKLYKLDFAPTNVNLAWSTWKLISLILFLAACLFGLAVASVLAYIAWPVTIFILCCITIAYAMRPREENDETSS